MSTGIADRSSVVLSDPSGKLPYMCKQKSESQKKEEITIFPRFRQVIFSNCMLFVCRGDVEHRRVSRQQLYDPRLRRAGGHCACVSVEKNIL